MILLSDYERYANFPYEITAEVDALAVSLVSVKTQLKLTGIEEDTFLTSLIKTASLFFESFTKQTLITKTYKTYRTIWDIFQLRRCPLLSITSIKYYDTDGALQTLDSADYYIVKDNFFGKVCFDEEFETPLLRNRPQQIEIEFKAGFGDISLSYRPAVYLKDDTAVDAGSEIIGQVSYSADGVAIANGDRLLLTAETTAPSTYKNKVFLVGGVGVAITLTLEIDGQAGDGSPTNGDTLPVQRGVTNGNKEFVYNGTDFVLSTSLANIPSDIQQGLLEHIAYMYENRGDCIDTSCSNISIPDSTKLAYIKYKIQEAGV